MGRGFLQNCIFINNSSKGDGGAVDLIAENETTFSNCTFVHNVAKSYGGAVSNSGSWVYYDRPLVRLKNCILWNNSSQGIKSHGFEPSFEPTKITLQERLCLNIPATLTHKNRSMPTSTIITSCKGGLRMRMLFLLTHYLLI